jgi:hypothetical protein
MSAEVRVGASGRQVVKERIRQMLRDAFELEFGGNARYGQRVIAFKPDAFNAKGWLNGIGSKVTSAFSTTLASPSDLRCISRNCQT